MLSAQDLSISGKVTDAAGAPLPGVAVQILGSQNRTLSDADGNYSLTGAFNSAILPRRKGSGLYGIHCDANGFLVYASSPTGLSLEIFDLSGHLLSTAFRGEVDPGKTAVPLPLAEYGRQSLVLKVIAGGAASTHILIPGVTGTELLFGKASADLVGHRGLAKAAAVDWLQATKPGYAAHVEQINAYAGKIDITLAGLTQPDFGPNALVFDPSMKMSDIQSQINAVKNKTDAEFGKNRSVILFKPGAYNLDVNMGFYMEVLGLGQLPDDVAITGAVRSKSEEGGGVLTNFWRSAGNLSVTPTTEPTDVWGVSQAAPLRRVHIKGSLSLSDGGWSSGGFLADSKVDGTVFAGTQQQWISRNDDLGTWKTNPGSWNFVFVGVRNAPTAPWPGAPHTVVDTTPVVREKPFLAIDKAGNYFVMAPSLKLGTKGVGWANGPEAGDSIPIDQFYLAHAGTDDAAGLNAALSQGKNLLFTPGIYHLSASLAVIRPNTVVLGLGMATLVPDNGTPAVTIADVDGVKFGGVILEAGPIGSATLLQVGEPGAALDHAANPVSLHDVFCRVGGASVGTASSCITINSNHVIADHFWLWRADHGAGANWNTNRCKNGLIVNGSQVTIYGLFDEHHQEYETLWKGEGGRLYFYQSEMPYDPPSQTAWQVGSEKGYASYKVADSVQTHEAWGLGVYSNFSNAPIIATNAVETPTGPGIRMHHLMTLWLNGNGSSQIANVYNGAGGAATQSSRSAKVTGQ